MKIRTRTHSFILIALGLFFVSPTMGFALCKNTPLNPITDICWQCMFPVKIGAVTMFNGDGTSGEAPPGEGVDVPGCVCGGPPPTTGLTVAFWEPARLVETVKDAYCFPSLGTSMTSPGGLDALSSGSHRSHSGSDGQTFASQQVHWYVFPVWTMMNLFGDFPCIEKAPFDVEMTEIDPLWNDDVLGFFLNPEALLFGNPVTQLACMADSVAAAAGKPIDALFWCLGSWGGAYPFTGSTTVSDPITYNAQFAARMLAKLSRELLVWDTALKKCSATGELAPIINKSHYRLQLAKPRVGADCIPIGQPSFLWGAGKNPPMGAGNNAPDNFLWVLNRARTCCVGYEWGK